MFTNPSTLWIEILVIVSVIAFIGVLIGRYIYKRIHHIPTGDCAYCHKGTKQMLKEYHSCYNKKD